MEEKLEKEKKNLERKILKLANNENVLIGIVVFLVLIIVLLSLNPTLINGLKGDGRYNIEAIKIEGCEDCFDLNLIAGLLEQENIDLKEKILDYNSREAKTLTAKYNIEKIPALIVKGKVDRLNLDADVFRISNSVAIFDKSVPYLDLKTEEKQGFVDLIEVYDSSCLDCSSLSNMKTSLENAGVKANNYEKVEINSEKGKALIKENSLTFLPSFLVSKNLKEYWWIFPKIESIFLEREHFVFKNPTAPYKDIKTGEIKGKVTITYITNKSCTDCYDVALLKDLFRSTGIFIDKERHVDVSSGDGKNLIKEYNITAIPTAVLSKEVSDYNLKSILEQVGRFKNDEFVLTNLDSLNVKYQRIGG